MIFLFNMILLFLVQQTLACPPDAEQLVPITNTLGPAFKAICGQGIKIGGADDVNFLMKNILPYYMSKTWLTKDPPKGWKKEVNNILSKCHKDTYNYCTEADRKKTTDCVKGMVGSLMLKYGATAMAYCPIIDKKVKNWEKSGDKVKALQFVTDFCKTKGKIC